MVKNRVAYNMAVLTVTGIITKTIDFAFRAYYSKHLGAEGMGIFSLIMSIFGVVLSLSSAGMGIAVSRLVSLNEEQGNKDKAISVVKTAVMLVFCVGAVCVSLVFFFAEWISATVLDEIRCAPGLLCIAPASVFMGISYCIKGYFYGLRKVAIPASSEFVEQAVKLCLISFFLKKGLPMGTEYGCAGVLLGMTIGEFCSCLYLCIRYKLTLKSKPTQIFPVRGILNMTIPMILSSVGNSFFRMIEDVLIIDGFERYGEKNAVGVYGLIKGMTMPLLVFPLNLISSFMALLVPEISRASENNRLSRIVTKVGKAGLFFGILVFVIFFVFAEDLSLMVYGTTSVAKYIKPFSLLCPVMVLDSLSAGMLGGLGEQNTLLRYSIFDTLLRLSLVYLLLPYTGNPAIIIMIFSSNIMTCFLNMKRVMKKAGSFIALRDTVNQFIRSGIVILLSTYLLPPNLNGIRLIISICAVAFFYTAIQYKKKGTK